MKKALIIGSFPDSKSLPDSLLKKLENALIVHAASLKIQLTVRIEVPDTAQEACQIIDSFRPDIVILCRYKFFSQKGRALGIAIWIDRMQIPTAVGVLNPFEPEARKLFFGVRCVKVFCSGPNRIGEFLDNCLKAETPFSACAK